MYVCPSIRPSSLGVSVFHDIIQLFKGHNIVVLYWRIYFETKQRGTHNGHGFQFAYMTVL